MKRIYYRFMLLVGSLLPIGIHPLCFGDLWAQVDTAWVRRYNGPANYWDGAAAMAVDKLGNVYVTGASDSTGTELDYATVKYSPNGTQLWVARYNGSGNGDDYPSAIGVDDSGNVYVTGRSYDGPTTGYDYATVKYSPTGEEQWIRIHTLQILGDDEARALVVSDSGNVYVTGAIVDSSFLRDYGTVVYNSSGEQVWARMYDGPGNGNDVATAIAVDDSGNVFVTGWSRGGSTNDDYATIKYNLFGQTLWVSRYDPVWGDAAAAIAVDDLGNSYVTGYSVGNGTSFDYATLKYSPVGEQLWVARFDGDISGWDEGSAIAVDDSGYVYVTGKSEGVGSGYDYVTIKYSSAGQIWLRRYNGPGNSWDRPYAITVDQECNVYVTGGSWGTETQEDYATIKYSSVGDSQWVCRYNGAFWGGDFASAIVVDDTGNVYVTGQSGGAGTVTDFATLKYTQSTSGQIAVELATNRGWNMLSISIITDDSRKTTLFPTAISRAFTYEGTYQPKDTLVDGLGYWLKFPSNQTVTLAGFPADVETVDVVSGWNMIGSIWQPISTSSITSNPPGLITSEFYGYERKYITTEIIIPGKGYWVKVRDAGSLILSSHPSGSALVKSSIHIVPTSELPPPPPNEEVSTHQSPIPTRFSLEQNYPNPFNPSTVIRYSLPVNGWVTLKVYDMLGREVAMLVDGVKQPGEYTVRWDASGLPSGVYFYRLTAGSFVETKKLMVMK